MNQGIEFMWGGAKIDNQFEEKAFLLIPVSYCYSIEKSFMQLDTGTPHSLIFKSKLPKKLRNNKYLENNNVISFYTDHNFVERLVIQESPKYDKSIEAQKYNQNVIGVLGMDIIQENILFIDYINNLIHISKKRIPRLQHSVKIQFDFFYKKIYLKLKLNNKDCNLIFDTGSSMFNVIFSQTYFDLNFDSNKVNLKKEFPVSSWSGAINLKIYESVKKLLLYPITLNFNNFFVLDFSHLKEENVENLLVENNIHGLVGNTFFLNTQVVIDFNEKTFMVKTPTNKK